MDKRLVLNGQNSTNNIRNQIPTNIQNQHPSLRQSISKKDRTEINMNLTKNGYKKSSTPVTGKDKQIQQQYQQPMQRSSNNRVFHQSQTIQQNTQENLFQDADTAVMDQIVDVDGDGEDSTKLIPLEINFLLKENRMAHQTDEYDYPYLILRRGEPFYISVRFDKPYDPACYTLTLQFTIGNQSLISKGTHIRIPVNGSVSIISGWKAQFVKTDSKSSTNTVKIEVTTVASAFIGRYKVYLETQYKSEKSCLFRYAEDIPLIINPFCKEDNCYMENENNIKEYVFNEDGIIYLGTSKNVIPRIWYYGQFQFPCLDIALWLLERANLPYESRGNVYHIVRALAAMINGGDRGMLESFKNASPNQQGFDPNEWIGSVKIAKKFMDQRGQPVRYGFSWTYSAMLCTLARALGIPCRVVTAFNIAHDCDLCSTVDVHWDKSRKPVNQLNKDIIKVSHTWNEMWFKREDIPVELNGWQVVDSSSVSASESLYRLGPCSVKSLKEGKYSYLSDGHSFMAMINGYMVHWVAERNGDMNPIKLEDLYLAPRIVTKSIESDAAIDLYSSYKSDQINIFDESLRVRKTKLIEYCNNLGTVNDVKSKVQFFQEATQGDTVMFTWDLQNTVDDDRTCEFYMTSYFATTDGKILSECKELRGETVVLSGKESRLHHMKIRADDYMDRIKCFHILRIYAQMIVLETGQIQPAIENFVFDSYDMIKLIVDNPTSIQVDRSFQVKIQITNPLKRVLQKCTLHIEGIGAPRTIILERALRPLEVTVYQAQLTAPRTGLKKLYVGFSCSIMNNICKILKLEVHESTTIDDEIVDHDSSE